MERRDALRNVALLLGGVVSASSFSFLFDGCSPPDKKSNENLFTADQETLITEIADVIIPDTETPGAKTAGVGPFIAMMIRDCYPDDAQKVFIDGLEEVDKLSDSKFRKSFVLLSSEEKNLVLKEVADKTIRLKRENKEKAPSGKKASNNSISDKKGKLYFFQLIRDLTLLGYFTSETGATKALAYLPVPGKYEACVDLKPGQKAWAM